MAKSKQIDVIGWYQPHISVDWDGMVADPKTGELVKEKSMTKQSFKDECDINNIVRRFEVGVMDELLRQAMAQDAFRDLPDSLDYHEALNRVMASERAFMALPAATRARFDNDPAAFLEFFNDPKNQEEAIQMGLAVDTRPPEPVPPPAPAPEPLK